MDDNHSEEEKRALFDLIAKVLLLRAGTVVHITREEIAQAMSVQCQIEGTNDRGIVFKVVMQ